MSTSYDRLPEHMQSAAKAYIERGRRPGNFLYNLLSNDLVGTFGRADEKNQESLDEWVAWMYNDIPASAWGSKDHVETWIESGGLGGRD